MKTIEKLICFFALMSVILIVVAFATAIKAFVFAGVVSFIVFLIMLVVSEEIYEKEMKEYDKRVMERRNNY